MEKTIITPSLSEKIQKAEKVLMLAAQMSKEYYEAPLIITYSGGKDSDVMLDIAMRCLSPDDFEVLNSHTTVDAPQTVYYIREKFKTLREKGIKCTIKYPQKTMWQLIVENKFPPSPQMRYCCKELKEASTPKRICAVGVREDESIKRRGRSEFSPITVKVNGKFRYYSYDHAAEVFEEAHQGLGDAFDCLMITEMKNKKEYIVNPIYKFVFSDIWEYIHTYIHTWNPLYDMGYDRVGCVGCPLGGRKSMIKEFADFPVYKRNYIKAFDRMLERYKERYTNTWKSGQDVFDWWVRDPNVKGQITIEEWMKGIEADGNGND